MLSVAEQKKLFAEEFGFEPMPKVETDTETTLPDLDVQKKLFAEEFGFEPPVEPLPKTTPIIQTEPEPISTGVTRSFEEPEPTKSPLQKAGSFFSNPGLCGGHKRGNY